MEFDRILTAILSFVGESWRCLVKVDAAPSYYQKALTTKGYQNIKLHSGLPTWLPESRKANLQDLVNTESWKDRSLPPVKHAYPAEKILVEERLSRLINQKYIKLLPIIVLL